MKKKFVFYMMAAALIMVVGCSKNKEENEEWIRVVETNESLLNGMIADAQCPSDSILGRKEDIVGRWRVIAVQDTNSAITDYSCEEIVFHFKENGVVSIENNAGNGLYGDLYYHFSAKVDFRCLPAPNLRFMASPAEITCFAEAFCTVLKSRMAFLDGEYSMGFPGNYIVLVRMQ